MLRDAAGSEVGRTVVAARKKIRYDTNRLWFVSMVGWGSRTLNGDRGEANILFYITARAGRRRGEEKVEMNFHPRFPRRRKKTDEIKGCNPRSRDPRSGSEVSPDPRSALIATKMPIGLVRVRVHSWPWFESVVRMRRELKGDRMTGSIARSGAGMMRRSK